MSTAIYRARSPSYWNMVRAWAPTAASGIVALAGGWATSRALGSRGVIIVTLLCSLPLAILLMGLRLQTRQLREALSTGYVGHATAWRWRRWIVIHSHHDQRGGLGTNEIRAGGKLFCAGCYGLLAGTLIGDAAAVHYLASGFDPTSLSVMSALLPLTFVPIVIRYTVRKRMSAGARFAANGLLALGCWLALLLVDALSASAGMNLIVFGGFGVVGYARQYAAFSEKAMGAGHVVVRP